MDRTLHGWAKNFKNVNKKWIGMFEANVKEDYQRIEQHGLPTYRKMFFEALELSINFDNCISHILLDRYYIQLYPKLANLPKYSLTDFNNSAEILGFINTKIPNHLSDYYVLVSEFEPNIYGGSVMSNGHEVHIDICKGLQNGISYGTANAISCRLLYGEILEPDNASACEISIFKQVLSAIKIGTSSSANEYMEGYFEFAITQKAPEADNYRLIFIDYKIDKNYYNI